MMTDKEYYLRARVLLLQERVTKAQKEINKLLKELLSEASK